LDKGSGKSEDLDLGGLGENKVKKLGYKKF